MTSVPKSDDLRRRASCVEGKFKILDGLYLIGSLEKRVTVYSQQVRAHNLVWALWELDDRDLLGKDLNIAVVGGGIAGLTAAACTLGLFSAARVTVFERSSDLCPLQQGCDSRWLHPRIYRWPELESRAPSASLPVLNWQEGRASDVADQILRGFGKYCDGGKPARAKRLSVYLGVDRLRISALEKEIEWTGRKATREGHFFRAGPVKRKSQRFHRILLAVGFGAESYPRRHRTLSYWRNEEYAQPVLPGNSSSYVLSGSGDGALVDLCRLRVERFRQDRIVYDLFDPDLARTERRLLAAWNEARDEENLYDLFKEVEHTALAAARRNLVSRIRKDTEVILHLAGRSGTNTRVADAFGNRSSFLNRLLLFLLYRSQAFTPSFDSLDQLAKSRSGTRRMVICRHGPDSLAHVKGLFVDAWRVERSLGKLHVAQGQHSRREWQPGCFPIELE